MICLPFNENYCFSHINGPVSGLLRLGGGS